MEGHFSAHRLASVHFYGARELEAWMWMVWIRLRQERSTRRQSVSILSQVLVGAVLTVPKVLESNTSVLRRQTITCNSKNQLWARAGLGVAQVVQCLLQQHEELGSQPPNTRVRTCV